MCLYLRCNEYCSTCDVLIGCRSLYPVAPSFYRRVVEEDTVLGYRLPRGTTVAYHVGALMRYLHKHFLSFVTEKNFKRN